jgi:hypothetical protein
MDRVDPPLRPSDRLRRDRLDLLDEADASGPVGGEGVTLIVVASAETASNESPSGTNTTSSPAPSRSANSSATLSILSLSIRDIPNRRAAEGGAGDRADGERRKNGACSEGRCRGHLPTSGLRTMITVTALAIGCPARVTLVSLVSSSSAPPFLTAPRPRRARSA